MMKSIIRIGRFSDFKAVDSTLWESSKLPFATAAKKQLDQINIKGWNNWKETKKEIHFQRKEVALFLNTELTNQTHFTW